MPPAQRWHAPTSTWSDGSLRRLDAAGQDPAGARVVAVVAVRIPLQVVLVLRLGLPERAGGLDRGDGRAWPQAGGVNIRDHL